jgi:hypothetical protein
MKRVICLLAAVGFVAIPGFVFVHALSAETAAGAVLQGPPPGPVPPPPAWDESWNRRPFPQVGACFYTGPNFSGNRFCMTRGQSWPELPAGYGNNISSIQTFGGAAVRIFNDSKFRNGSILLRHPVPDMRDVPFRDGHTWNNRISAIEVF